ncbi:MAG: DUF6516 family protein [Thermodesulfobacteriota bacterium]
MLLTEYAARLARIVDDFSRTGLIVDSSIAVDSRAPKIGVVRGAITFADESRLFLTEYLDLRYRPEKLSYAFQYQDGQGALRFRYDNARHKPALSCPDHKHLGDGSTVIARPPELETILVEIMDDFMDIRCPEGKHPCIG